MTVNYKQIYDSAVIKPEKKAELKIIAGRIKSHEQTYQKVADTLGNGIPWWFIGITHFMEAGAFKNPFLYHLHCGDPLTGRTTHVPKGRPKHNPGHGTRPPSKDNPYSWEESALDALTYMGYDKQTTWGIENCLFLFEKYNGMGYNKRNLLSPYLWSYTNHYTKGKYAFDGKYDPNLVSKQPGVAAIMKTLNV